MRISLFVVILAGVAGIASPASAQVFEGEGVAFRLPRISGEKWTPVRDCKTAQTRYTFCAKIDSSRATVGVVKLQEGKSAESHTFLSAQVIFLKHKDDPGFSLVSRQLMVMSGSGEDLHVWVHDLSSETQKYSWAIGCARRRCIYFYFNVASMPSELVRKLFAGVTIGKDADK